MGEKEKQLEAEVARLLQAAEAVDAAEDTAYGKGQRGGLTHFRRNILQCFDKIVAIAIGHLRQSPYGPPALIRIGRFQQCTQCR